MLLIFFVYFKSIFGALLALFSAPIKHRKVIEVRDRKLCTAMCMNNSSCFKESLVLAYTTQNPMSALFQLNLNARLTLIMDAFSELSEKQNQPVLFI